MATNKKPPVKRGPGRRRADGHAHNSEAAYAAKGLGRLSLRLPLTSLALLDRIAAGMGCGRAAAIVVLLGLGVEAGYGRRS